MYEICLSNLHQKNREMLILYKDIVIKKLSQKNTPSCNNGSKNES